MSWPELTSAKVKQFALETLHVDKIGIANIERFKDAPADMDPRAIMPNVRSVIVFVKRILRGSYRGIDEGTHWPSYTIFCYAGLSDMLSKADYRLARFVEDHGYEATSAAANATLREFGPPPPRRDPGKPPREVAMHFRIAATLAGLGEMGWSKVFLTEEFGPRQRIGILLTDAELEPDPVRTGRLCDQCKRCTAECPAGAIPKDDAVRLDTDDLHLAWARIDLGKCKLTHFGLNRCTAPFLIKRFPGLNLPIAEQNTTWLESWDLGWAVFSAFPTYQALARHGVPALCGARGCIIACMKHLEQKGVLKNRFRTKPVFSTEKPWRLPDAPSPMNHQGFVYDPDRDENLLARFANESAGRASWY